MSHEASSGTATQKELHAVTVLRLLLLQLIFPLRVAAGQ